MIKLILIAALLFVSGASMAQKVVVGAKGEAIIDNRSMTAKAITTDKKARVIPAGNPNTIDNIASQESNKTISHYFEVMKTDYTSMTWTSAINGCANYDSGDWRLPTQRELMLIWTMYESLKKKVPGFASFATDTPEANNYYWSATESYNDGWSVRFAHGRTAANNKTYTYSVRCIRDLTPAK